MVQARAGSGDTVGIMVRLPEGLRDRIKAAAEEDGRSMNSEIVATLEEAYPAPEPDENSLENMINRAINDAGITDNNDPRLDEVIQATLDKWRIEVFIRPKKKD